MPGYFNNGQGITRKTASEREIWYTLKSQCFLQQRKYDDCVIWCDKALHDLSQFVNHSDMWFRYRKIKALYLEGNVTEAAAALPDILQGTVANWVIYALASAIMQQQDDKEKTLLYAGYCALFDTSYEKRVKVYRRLVPVLYDMGEVRLAMLHRQFTDILYKENNWSIRSWKLDWEVSQEIMTMPKKDILRELTSAWRTWRNQNKVFFKGIVKCILPSGRDGFITGEGNQDYYFKMRDIEFGRSHLQSGSHVRFTTCKRLNKKKQREEENATEISVES